MSVNTYEEMWNEHKKWLDRSVEYLEIRMKETNGEEKVRIKNKLEGMKVSLDHLKKLENMIKEN